MVSTYVVLENQYFLGHKNAAVAVNKIYTHRQRLFYKYIKKKNAQKMCKNLPRGKIFFQKFIHVVFHISLCCCCILQFHCCVYQYCFSSWEELHICRFICQPSFVLRFIRSWQDSAEQKMDWTRKIFMLWQIWLLSKMDDTWALRRK